MDCATCAYRPSFTPSSGARGRGTMEIEDNKPRAAAAALISALERARILSQALSDAARRSRISSRSRRYSGGGFQARRGAALMRWAAAVSFCLIVVLPSVATAIYYTFLASDQYVAETRFTVSGGEAPAIDGIGAMTGHSSDGSNSRHADRHELRRESRRP